jgi:hypothetical protein
VNERGEERKGEGLSGLRICDVKRGQRDAYLKKCSSVRTYEEKSAADDDQPDVVCSSSVKSRFLEHLRVAHAGTRAVKGVSSSADS